MLLLAVAASTHADEEEASLVLEAGPAFLSVEELHDTSSRTTIAGAGGALRFAYGLSDLLAVDIAVGGALARNAEYHDQMIDATTRGNVLQDAASVRATVGVTLRLGAKWIPTVGARIGYQRHFLTNAVLFNDSGVALRPLPDRGENDLLAAASFGMELRLNRHWLVGLSAELSYAFGLGGNSLAALELPVRLTYSFYPGWFHSTRVTRFGD